MVNRVAQSFGGLAIILAIVIALVAAFAPDATPWISVLLAVFIAISQMAATLLGKAYEKGKMVRAGVEKRHVKSVLRKLIKAEQRALQIVAKCEDVQKRRSALNKGEIVLVLGEVNVAATYLAEDIQANQADWHEYLEPHESTMLNKEN